MRHNALRVALGIDSHTSFVYDTLLARRTRAKTRITYQTVARAQKLHDRESLLQSAPVAGRTHLRTGTP